MTSVFEDNGSDQDHAIERRFFGWLAAAVTSVGILTIGGVSAILWNFNTSVVRLSTTVDNLGQTITSMQSQIGGQTADRYTGTQAAVDRASVLKAIDSLALRIDANTAKLSDHDRELRNLAVFDAEVRATMHVNGLPSSSK